MCGRVSAVLGQICVSPTVLCGLQRASPFIDTLWQRFCPISEAGTASRPKWPATAQRAQRPRAASPTRYPRSNIPSEQTLLHTAIKIREELDDNLATLGLLGITKGADASARTLAFRSALTWSFVLAWLRIADVVRVAEVAH